MAKFEVSNFWQDAQGRTVIWQSLNKWAWTAIVSWLFARTFQDSGLLDFLALLVFYPSAGYWAYLEITQGSSPFRRGLGGLVVIALAASLIRRLA